MPACEAMPHEGQWTKALAVYESLLCHTYHPSHFYIHSPHSHSSHSYISSGLTKLVSQMSREGHWAKALEVYESLDAVGVRADTTITNAAISACDRGGQWEKALQVFR